MYNLIGQSNAYSKTSGILWQYYRDEISLDNDYNIIAIPTDNNSNSFKFKQQTSEKSGNGEKNRC